MVMSLVNNLFVVNPSQASAGVVFVGEVRMPDDAVWAFQITFLVHIQMEKEWKVRFQLETIGGIPALSISDEFFPNDFSELCVDFLVLGEMLNFAVSGVAAIGLVLIAHRSSQVGWLGHLTRVVLIRLPTRR